MRHRTHRVIQMVMVAASLPMLTGCATLQQYAALRNVDWAFDRVSGVQLADIVLTGNVNDYTDLSAVQIARFLDTVSRGELPLQLVAHVSAHNPESNSVTARLMDFDWTLFIEDKETVGGRLGNTYSIPPGQTVDVPVAVRLDLFEFFEGSAQEAFNLALAIAGHGSQSSELRLELVPTIETALGPMTYPSPIVVRRQFGG